MDVSKYRTRFPPKEHEEAVRMLLEGLGKQTPPMQTSRAQASGQHDDLKPQARPVPPVYSQRSGANEPRAAFTHEPSSPASSVDSGSLARCDPNGDDDGDEQAEPTEYMERTRASSNDQLLDYEQEFNSEETSSQEQIQVSPQIASKHGHHRRQQSMNKVTNKRLLDQRMGEFRATSKLPRVQSRATSTSHSESLSASSSSSSNNNNSNNGSSNRRRDALRSVDDDDDGEQHDDHLNGPLKTIPNRTIAIQCDLKLSSVKRDGFLLTTDTASSDAASMRASSISSTRYGFYELSPALLEQRRRLARSVSSRNIAQPTNEQEKEDGGEPANSEARRRRSYSSTIDAEDDELNAIRSRTRENSRSHSEQEFDEPSLRRTKMGNRRLVARHHEQAPKIRARETLPSRPKTALSYVSNSRLRDGDGSEGSLSGPEDEESTGRLRNGRQLRDRAMSYQVLSSNGVGSRATRGRRLNAEAELEMSSSNSEAELSAGADRYRVPRNEEILLTRRAQQVSARPVSQLSRRSNTLTDGVNEQPPTNWPPKTVSTNNLNRGQHEATSQAAGEPGRVQEFSHGADLAPLKSTRQAAATRNQLDEPRKLSRFSSMSLSRAPARSAIDRSCNLISGQIKRATATFAREPNGSAETGGLGSRIHLDRGQGSVGATAAASLRERASSQQTLPSGGRPRRESLVSRSRSLRQVDKITGVGSRLLLPAQRQREAPHASEQRATSRRFYSTAATTDCDSSCCEQAPLEKEPESRRFVVAAANQSDEMGVEIQPPSSRSHAIRRTQLNGGDPSASSAGAKRSESEDSESPLTRTWANPSSSRAESGQHKRLIAGATNSRRLKRSESGAIHFPTGEPIVGAPNTREARPTACDISDEDLGETSGEFLFNSRSSANGRRRLNNRFEHIYRANQDDEEENGDELAGRDLNSASWALDSNESSAQSDLLTRAAAHHQPLDFDSQQRLNEIGLPEPSEHDQLRAAAISSAGGATLRPIGQRHMMAPSVNSSSSSSHLGLAQQRFQVSAVAASSSASSTHYGTTGRRSVQAHQQHHLGSGFLQRGPAITGRAMSQQSLTRPTMPLCRRLRRSGAGGSQSGASDVGGSSMSLVSRVRYENAHTRTPVVMYIPQPTPKSSSSEQLRRSGGGGGGGGTLLRKSSRQSTASKTTGRHSASQERAKRKSFSRHGSDSDASSSSMLRTLVEPRTSRGTSNRPTQGTGRWRLGLRRDLSDDEENMDGVGQLATEIDTYKFRRRYSVPKDAKINWFSKLKQRVSSKGS